MQQNLLSRQREQSPHCLRCASIHFFWRDSVVFGVNVSLTPLGLAFFLSIRLDSIISLQFACGKLVSLVESESPLVCASRLLHCQNLRL
ncbi:hypothetical protein [uncultured Helicobacter sp.]|uniref:hypothetical protein n=1 Tax=uncultured Helicobacter sp. TaxID=175537 RepID=UPI001C3A90AA|nr:hypothetical protein [Candidatus Helicobacter avicola]